MSEGSSVEGAYAAPEAAIDGGAPGVQRVVGPVRLAAVFLLVAGAIVVSSAVAQFVVLRWVPTWSRFLFVAAPIAIGLALLARGQRLARLMLVLLVVMEAPQFAGLAPLWEVEGGVALIVPLVVVGVRLSPFALLLLGNPGRGRIFVASAIFVISQLVVVGGNVYQLIVLSRNVAT